MHVQNVQRNVTTGALLHRTRSHAFSSATTAATSACASPPAHTATRKSARATTTWRPSKAAPNARKMNIRGLDHSKRQLIKWNHVLPPFQYKIRFGYFVYVFYICIYIYHHLDKYAQKNQGLKRTLFWNRESIIFLICNNFLIIELITSQLDLMGNLGLARSSKTRLHIELSEILEPKEMTYL